MIEWVRTYERGADYIESVNGIDWHAAPMPGRFHSCFPQTRGWMGLSYTERCACGAIRFSARERWMERNATRKQRRKAAAEARLPRVQVTCGTCGKPYEVAEGTPIARQELCTDCWAKAFIRAHGSAS